MVSLKVVFHFLLIAVVSSWSIENEERLLNKFAGDFFTYVDPRVVVKFIDDHDICNIIVPFKSNGAEGCLRLRHLELVPTVELTPSAVTIYDVTDNGQAYHFNLTYSLSNTAYRAKNAEVLADGKLIPVRSTIKFPSGFVTLTFQRQTVGRNLVVRVIKVSLKIPNGVQVTITNVERQLAKYLEQEVAAQVLSDVVSYGNLAWQYVAETYIGPGFENAIMKDRLVRIPLKLYQSLFNTTEVPSLVP